jgi:hypothetical protein
MRNAGVRGQQFRERGFRLAVRDGPPYHIRVYWRPFVVVFTFASIRGCLISVNQRFFEITSREEKIAYVPVSQLLRIEAVPQGGIFLNFAESFQVNVEIADGAEPAVVKSLYGEIASASTEPIRLNPETFNITDIHF